MRARVLAAVVAAGLAMGFGAADAQTAPVATQQGLVQGADQGGVTSWLGIPFAAPPVGDLRWRPPQLPASWQGVRAGDKFGAPCMQGLPPGAPGADRPQSEDCLYLNIWAGDGPRTGKRPVMFYIHGGGFQFGMTAWHETDGSSLARHGVIVVTTAYRLGKFGFFAHPALIKEARGGPAGNYGLMDMVAALKWVKANIAAFGGDPDNITIFGESAGGGAVDDLMISPSARGLFKGAIVESGGPVNLRGLKKAEADGVALAAAWGVTSDDPAALRAVPAATVLAKGPGSSPMVDGVVLPLNVIDAFKAGQVAHVPIIFGTNSYEAGAFQAAAKDLDKKYAAEWPQITKVYDGYGTHDPLKVQGQLATDLVMTWNNRQTAMGAAEHGMPTYVYSFNYLRPSQQGKTPGASHFDEVYAVFGTTPTRDPTDVVEPSMIEAMESHWAEFAKTGSPGPDWPRYTPQTRTVEVFSNTGVKAEPGYEKARMELDASLPQMPAP
ncbi:MAG TPA: carboxylesterase family protein [Caulobacteraceae bacterium]|nr:carboxylesterase family protein [Caulobacteraceae bacterium]